MITTRDAVMILDRNGLRISSASQSYGEIMYNGERVGTLYADEVYIPSMIDGDYESVNKTIININGKDTVERLETQIDRLYDTPRRWEEHLRESRLNRVRKYFQDRKDAETVLSQPTYDYKKLLNQLTFQRREEKLQ